MIRRLLKTRKPRPKASPRRVPARRRSLALQSLEERALLAVLTNGQGEGQVFVEVNEQGAFGNSPDLAVNLPNRPQQNDVADAVFNPQGPRIPFGTTYESGIAIRIIAPGTSREFITAGTIANTGNNVNGFFLDPSPNTPQNNLERNSRFFWPNTVARPNNADDIPTGARLRFDLQQTLVDLEFMGSQDGTALVQEYTIQNISGGTLNFELIRYWDGDLFSMVGGGAGNTPLDDGGGRRIFDVRRGVDSVFQTDMANNDPANDPTFHEIQSSIDNVPRSERWEVGLAGNVLPDKPPGPLLQAIIAGQPLADDVTGAAGAACCDTDANNVRDVGQDDDVAVALRQEFINVPNNGFVVFVSTTVFGHPPRGSIRPPTPQFGRVEGTKFSDVNSNGMRDPGEPGVSGFIIYADLNQNGVRDANEPSTVTDQNGMYSLSVPLGMIQIREVNKANWTQTAPATFFHVADIAAAGDIVPDLDFGNVADPGQILGTKFEDDDRSGSRGANEPGMPGVTIYLDLDDDGVLDAAEPQTTTDAQGDYAFANLQPGEYTVREVEPAGFEQTAPGGDGAHRIRLNAGQIVTGRDFGNRLRRGSIQGVKWNDLNGDGVRTPDEPRVGGAIIYIDVNEDGALNLGEPAAITNARGEYEIKELLPGEYVIREFVPTGTAVTFPAAGFHRKVVFAGLPTPDVDFGNRTNFDFGDAPNSYGTLLASNGARHAIVPGFQLGQRIDGEADGQPTAGATGDDANGGGYAAPINYAVGDQPRDLIFVDVNGDNIPDLVTANFGSDNVSVALGRSDGTFRPATNFDVDRNPVGVFAADIDGMMGLDLVVAHEGDNDVAVLLNNGAGGFAPAVTFPAGGAQSDVVALDFDNDGDTDILATRPGTNDLVVLLNTGGAMLAFDPVDPALTFPVGTNPVAIEVGRVNNDALNDLVIVNRDSNNISVMLRRAAGGFNFPVNYTVGTNPADVVIADLDGDGDRDLAVANETSGTVTVLYNNGAGVFPNADRKTFDVPGNPVSIAAGLFDGQPGVDLAVALQASNSVAVLSNDGTGEFPAASVFQTANGPSNLVVTNLDADNITDIITGNFGSDTVSVLTFTGGDEDGVRFAGAFAPDRVTGVTVNASAAGFVNAWFDFNRNGTFESSERLISGAPVVAGDNQFFISTPAGTADGPVITRFRFSAQQNLGPTGPAGSGEVEDHLIQVLAGGGGIPNTGHTNVGNPEDVDGNGRVELFDVLVLVNDLRANGVRTLPPVVNPPPPPPFLDVNGNGLVELNDVLRVIQRILTQMPGALNPEPEGEAEPEDAFESALDDIASDVCFAWMEE